MAWFQRDRKSHARLNPPVLVSVAAIGIITTRCLDLLMIFNMLGVSGIKALVFHSVQTWSLTAIMLGSLLILLIQFRSAFSILHGHNGGRWLFLLTQVVVVAYLWAASLGFGYPQLFSLSGGSKQNIFSELMLQKLPDCLMLLLLFLPSSSRRFFQLR